MEKHRYELAIACSIILSFGLVAFTTCIAAEFKRTKAKDLKLDGKLCHLPGSPAFGLGFAALICLFVSQIVGNAVIGKQFLKREKKTRKQIIEITLLVLSWVSFGLAIILLSVATSMNRRQPYGKGWLDGECYIVKRGVYLGSAALVLAILIFILSTIFLTRTRYVRKQVELGVRIHAQAVGETSSTR